MPVLKQELRSCVPVTLASLQLSVATGITQVALAQVSELVKTILVGQNGKRGFMVSFAQGLVIVTVKAHVDVLFLLSFAE
jgi:hypothetical protein